MFPSLRMRPKGISHTSLLFLEIDIGLIDLNFNAKNMCVKECPKAFF
jgi:hypothetical protein